MSYSLFARLVGLVSLLLAAPLASAQDDSPGYPAPAPVSTEAPAPALMAQATVAPKATSPALITSPKRAHDPLSPPVFQAGDSCTYGQVNSGERRYDYSEEVAFINQHQVITKTIVHGPKGPWVGGYLQLTPQGNLVDWHRNGVSRLHTPAKEYIRFPLTKTWQVDVKLPHTIGNKVVGIREERLTATFLGVEAVTVPAGTFPAIHVRLEGKLILNVDKQHLELFQSARAEGTFREDWWYSTELACYVRHTRYSQVAGLVRDNFVGELISFRRYGWVPSEQ